MHLWAVEGEPAFEGAFARYVVERPLHRDAFYVEALSVVFVLQDFGGMTEIIADLDRIPPDVLPHRLGLFLADGVRHGAAVERR